MSICDQGLKGCLPQDHRNGPVGGQKPKETSSCMPTNKGVTGMNSWFLLILAYLVKKGGFCCQSSIWVIIIYHCN